MTSMHPQSLGVQAPSRLDQVLAVILGNAGVQGDVQAASGFSQLRAPRVLARHQRAAPWEKSVPLYIVV